MAENAADEAKKGLLGSLTGKAKEVAGAVLGNDSLAAEGQLQQAEAQARRDANAREAVAQVQAREAAEDLAVEQAAADRERQTVDTVKDVQVDQARTAAAIKADAVEADVARQQAVGTAVAEAQADADERQARAAAAQQSQDAAQHAAAAEREHSAGVAEARAAESAAARARAEADRLAGDAGLPG